MQRDIYLDYNGAAPLRPEARQAILQAMDLCGNPSAVHAYGRQSRHSLEDAREQIAQHVGAETKQVIFTSGGTEANALALQGLASHVKHVFVSAVEHESVLKQVPSARILPVNSVGQVEPCLLEAALENVPSPFLCSVVWGHNETGVLNDIKTLAHLVQARGGIFHTDAVQIIGKYSLSFQETGADLMTLSAHKMGGPAGIGALLVKDHVPLTALLKGGGQERGMRSGTLNVALARGWAAALEAAVHKENDWKQVEDMWQRRFENELRARNPESWIIGEKVSRLSQTTCVTMPGVTMDVQLMRFDLEGLSVSSGSSCSSGKMSVSPRLLAMGIPYQLAETAIRVSWGWATKWSDLQRFLEVWSTISQQLGQRKRVSCG